MQPWKRAGPSLTPAQARVPQVRAAGKNISRTFGLALNGLLSHLRQLKLGSPVLGELSRTVACGRFQKRPCGRLIPCHKIVDAKMLVDLTYLLIAQRGVFGAIRRASYCVLRRQAQMECKDGPRPRGAVELLGIRLELIATVAAGAQPGSVKPEHRIRM